MIRTSIGVVLVVLSGFPLAAVDGNAALPEGPGKALVERTCKSCHTLSVVTARKRTEAQWVQVISAMLSRGAEATDDEAETILDYLVKNFGKDIGSSKSGDSRY
jgi:cytochrome c5